MQKYFDEVNNVLRIHAGEDSILQLWEVVIALSVCLMCTLLIATIYRKTHQGASYSQSFTQTIVVTGMVTTVIMLVIGSNIARAFSLVGALSIIRFRNAVKETRDVGFIFFAMAMAMACGTRFYGVAVTSTMMISLTVILMHLLDFGKSTIETDRLLRVQLPPGTDPEERLTPVLKKYFTRYSIISIESVKQGLLVEVVMAVRPKQGISGAVFLEELSAVNGNLKIRYDYGIHTEDL